MRGRVHWVVLIAGILAMLVGVYPRVSTQAAMTFGDAAFQAQWQAGESITPNFWGPLVLARDGQIEPYAESTNGQRLVQYFDKARMERRNDGGVTNGLLATELITGQLQLGDNTFQQGNPAAIPVAGDPDNPGPTYASITANKANLLDPTESTMGVPATKALSASGQSGTYTAPTSDANMLNREFDTVTRHNVPKAFADYRQKVGLQAIGLAISEPFWSNVRVAGVSKDVLIQAFERRVLTYTPANPVPSRSSSATSGSTTTAGATRAACRHPCALPRPRRWRTRAPPRSANSLSPRRLSLIRPGGRTYCASPPPSPRSR